MVVGCILFLSSSGLLLLSFHFIHRAQKTRKRYHIQEGHITYSDLNSPAKPLFSSRYRIAGKPDYIIKKDNHSLPVEVKSGDYHTPQTHHIYQLAAYCQLIEDTRQGFVPYGILVYNDDEFTIPFDPKVRFELEQTISRMRHSVITREPPIPSHDGRRCISCSMRHHCNYKITPE